MKPQQECYYCDNRTIHSDGDFTCHCPDKKVKAATKIRTANPGHGVRVNIFQRDPGPLVPLKDNTEDGWGYPDRFRPMDKKVSCKNYQPPLRAA